jgi:two-component system, cell cycle sensor histidine kinase and response regulator CckA
MQSTCTGWIGSSALAEVVRSQPKTILLVEDEAFVRSVTAEVLQSAGYSTVIAASATEALDTCRECGGQIDLLLTDVVMPGMSGRELATHFEKYCPNAQVLLMSGYAEQLPWWELSTSQRKCLAKPFSAGILLQRVRETLDMQFEIQP